ncbi:MAG: hypothetical protein JXM69_14535 [Anaerolineae bacterium]|nr:hypothetical protein [Anaerolineae bacterium]
MGLTGKRTYVGFGFGAIQAGLFLYEAFRADVFGRLVVAEVMPEVVTAVRQAKGYFWLNIAHADRIEQTEIGPIEIENPAHGQDRQRLIRAIAGAEELGTAIPSITHYVSAGPGSLHRLLAAGLREKAARGGPPAVIYAAENHNHAAEILAENVLAEIPANERSAVQARVRFLNTVIGKMSGVITTPQEIQARGIAPVTPAGERAFLVESFNRILISKIRFDKTEGAVSFRRGIGVFEEKDQLLPFEEAKLYGHNAFHALAAYIGAVRGVKHIIHLQAVPGVFPFLRAASLAESGQALIRKYGGVDPLFTATGFRHYADDLLARMVNPYLGDTIERVTRDPARKLGWNDRLIGTMRLALQQGIKPCRYAFGAAAALTTMAAENLALTPATLNLSVSAEKLLTPLWQSSSPAQPEQKSVLKLVEQGQQKLNLWVESGYQDLERLFNNR